MAELAPGLYVASYLEPGTAFVLNIGHGKALALATADWERLDPAEREKLLDTLTREDAERGLALLEGMLARG